MITGHVFILAIVHWLSKEWRKQYLSFVIDEKKTDSQAAPHIIDRQITWQRQDGLSIVTSIKVCI